MDRVCPRCGAEQRLDKRVRKTGSTNVCPLFGVCCNDGGVQLPPPPPPPDALRCFFSASTPDARNFCDNVRQCNSALAFTSLGVQIDESGNRGEGGPPVFRIQGELHQIGSLLPSKGQPPAYAQPYILDSHDARDHRMRRNSNLDPDVMYRLGGLIPSERVPQHRAVYRIQQREHEFSLLLYGGCLFQQYLVDM